MQNYLRWPQVNFSASKITCGGRRNFLQLMIACGICRFLAKSYLSPQVIYARRSLCVSEWTFSKLGTFSFIQHQTTLPQYPIAAFKINAKAFEYASFPKKLDCSLLVVQSVIQKKQPAETFFTITNLIRNWPLSLFCSFSRLSSEGKLSS